MTLEPTSNRLRQRARISGNSSLPFLQLALAAALVASVERLGVTVFYDKDSFHGPGEGAYGNSDKLEAFDFSV
jgi:hypothetical protein